MNKPKGFSNIFTYADRDAFMEAHKAEILRQAVDAIEPDKMGMTREQALTLAGAMKNCDFDVDDFAAVMSRSSQDKGTFVKQWEKFRGKGKNGEATEGTIYSYAKKCGWTFPNPADFDAHISTTAKSTPKKPAGVLDAAEGFKLYCMMDDVCYDHKPDKSEAMAIRSRERIPTPYPEGITLDDFARAVTSGRTFSPTIYRKEQTGINAKTGKPEFEYIPIAQQLFIVDIDNDKKATDAAGKAIKGQKVPIDKPLTLDDINGICANNGIEPFFMYETFSSKYHRDDAEKPYKKYRICFATNEPLTVREYGEYGIRLIKDYFISLFGEAADTATTDTARLIFGTDEPERSKLTGHIIKKNMLVEKVLPRHEADDIAADTTQDTKQAAPVNVASVLDAFIPGIMAEADLYPPIKTGFKELDAVLDGGLYTGLYFLGAISSLGKTSFALQMADNIAESGHDVLIFSLEMAMAELMAKSISRITFENAQGKGKNPKSTRGILSGVRYYGYDLEERQAIDDAVRCYRTMAEHIYISEGVGDIGINQIRDKVQAHISATNRRPVVLIDYLQILEPLKDTASDKQNTDKAVVELKRLSRDCKIPIIGISSFNRENYTAPVNNASFKESGAIEYSADVLIGMQYKGMDYIEYDNGKCESKEQRQVRVAGLLKDIYAKTRYGEPAPVQLKVLKNRNGVKDDVYYDFYAKYNYFDEIKKVYEWDDTIPAEWCSDNARKI